MCPAFGSLRVGLRMRRTATVLSGSACCVYGLTFTSHFYGARRTVGYVPFNSETLVTGKLFEDIREAVHKLADPANYDAIVVTNLCVPTASGVPLRAAAEGDQRRAHHRHRRAGLRRADARGSEGRAGRRDARATRATRPSRGRCSAARRHAAERKPTVTLLGEMFPADPVGIGMMLEPLGLAAGPVVPTREWRELYAALDCVVVAAIHPFYTASVREFEAAGRPIVGSAPVGHDGTDSLARRRSATPRASRRSASTPPRTASCRRSAARSRSTPIKGRITLSGYEGSELLVARLLVESGADVRYVGTACPRTPWSDADREWLEAKGVHVQYRASLEQDLAAMREFAAGPRDRHDAGRAGGEGGGDPGALLHQPHLGAPADGAGGRRLARARGQRGAGEQGALRPR